MLELQATTKVAEAATLTADQEVKAAKDTHRPATQNTLSRTSCATSPSSSTPKTMRWTALGPKTNKYRKSKSNASQAKVVA